MAAEKRPETFKDLAAIMHDMEKNVVSTGAGSLPTRVDNEKAAMYFQTAMDALMSKITDPMMTTDRELLQTKSPRLTQLGNAARTGKEKARFKVVATPKVKNTTEALHEQATTIQVGNSIIRPVVDEGVAR